VSIYLIFTNNTFSFNKRLKHKLSPSYHIRNFFISQLLTVYLNYFYLNQLKILLLFVSFSIYIYQLYAITKVSLTYLYIMLTPPRTLLSFPINFFFFFQNITAGLPRSTLMFFLSFKISEVE
jgi:hypothetical protein